MKTNNTIIRALTLILTLALALSVFATPAFAAEVPPTDMEEEATTTSYFEEVSEATAELRAEDAEATEESEEVKIDFVPLYNQGDYNIRYGTYGNVASGGCGLVSVWMIAEYYNDELYDIGELAVEFGGYHVRNAGSSWAIFQGTAEALGLPLIASDANYGEWYDWDKVIEALEDGNPVVCLQRAGIFTGGGHFIVLTGITEDGKILVNDPNGYNWAKNATMVEGFANGFTPEQIRAAGIAYWIYGDKYPEQNEVKINIRPVLYDDATPVANGDFVIMAQ